MRNTEVVDHHLKSMLGFAVPLWSAKVARYRDEVAIERARAAGAILANCGDALLWRRSKSKTGRMRDIVQLWIDLRCSDSDSSISPPPTSGEVFNAVAEGLAIHCRYSGRSLSDAVDTLLSEPKTEVAWADD